MRYDEPKGADVGKTMTTILKTAAFAVAVLATGAAAVTALNRDLPDFAVPAGPWQAGSDLDGRAFHVTGTVQETGAAMPETVLSFVDGQFQSSRCQVACTFGWNEYQSFTEGERIHFTATTRCPEAPFTVVWYGTVVGDEAQIAGTWTVRRWYWTHQATITAAEGSLV
jgi:hypothetical protein